jgi:hypothetical protein
VNLLIRTLRPPRCLEGSHFPDTLLLVGHRLPQPLAKMFLRNLLLPLLASGAVVVALPGGAGGAEKTPAHNNQPSPKQEEHKTSAKAEPEEKKCSTQMVTKQKEAESKTTEKVTKTIYVPVTAVENKPYTTVKPVPYTSVGKSKTVETIYETFVETKVVPVTTVIYSTKSEQQVKTKTTEKEVPTT